MSALTFTCCLLTLSLLLGVIAHTRSLHFYACPSLAAIESKAASILSSTSPSAASDAAAFLTDYSTRSAQETVSAWRALGETLIVKYLDGYVRDSEGKPQARDYPESWRREVVKETGGRYLVPVSTQKLSEMDMVMKTQRGDVKTHRGREVREGEKYNKKRHGKHWKL